MKREPKQHPADMMDCKCNTGEQHGKERAKAQARWDAWYESIQDQQENN